MISNFMKKSKISNEPILNNIEKVYFEVTNHQKWLKSAKRGLRQIIPFK